MTNANSVRNLFSINLDLHLKDSDSPDQLKLFICNDFAGVAGLITDTRRWLGTNFLNGPKPSNDDLEKLLGADFIQPTIEFVYPVEANATKDIVVQLLEGTNVITVRSTMAGQGVDGFLADGPLSITLFSKDEHATSGLAYCHQHFLPTMPNDGVITGDHNRPIDAVLKEVAAIIQNPQGRLGKMSDQKDKTTRKVYKSGNVKATTTDTIDVKFHIKPRPGATPSGENSDGELRFLFLCHLDSADGKPFAGELLPCIKSSGTYVQPVLPEGLVSMDVDTIVFVDYASPAMKVRHKKA